MKLIMLAELPGELRAFAPGDVYPDCEDAEALRLVDAGFAKVHPESEEAFAAARAAAEAQAAEYPEKAAAEAQAAEDAEKAAAEAQAAEDAEKAAAEAQAERPEGTDTTITDAALVAVSGKAKKG
jgi:sRNA-binding protein